MNDLEKHQLEEILDHNMIYRCAFCESPAYMSKWFLCPGTVYRPNEYSVCEKHQDLYLTWEDVYPDPIGPAIVRHEDKIK